MRRRTPIPPCRLPCIDCPGANARAGGFYAHRARSRRARSGGQRRGCATRCPWSRVLRSGPASFRSPIRRTGAWRSRCSKARFRCSLLRRFWSSASSLRRRYGWASGCRCCSGSRSRCRFGGAVGNLIDRVVFRWVTDMFDFRLIHFPIFNVADSAITVGVLLLAYRTLTTKEESQPVAAAPSAERTLTG